MKKILIIIALIVLSVLNAKADDPYNKFTYQGVLTNSDGTVVSDGTYDFVFKVYDVSTAGTALSTFTKTGISVSKGLFQVELGETGEFEGLDFITTPYYIEITVGSTTLSPRIEINPVGKSIISRNLKNGTVTNADITGSNIQNTPIGTTSPSTGKFTSLESGTLKITSGTLAANKVLNSDIDGNATWTNALNSISIGATSASTGAFTTLSAGSGKFAVDANGNITKINNVTTSFPASQASANTYLKNDGAGNMTWATVSGGSPSGAAGGDLNGTYPNPSVASGAISTSKLSDNSVTGAKIALGSDATGDMMYYNGTDYTRLAAGSNGNVLTMSSGVPSWGSGGSSAVAVSSYQTISNLSLGASYVNFGSSVDLTSGYYILSWYHDMSIVGVVMLRLEDQNSNLITSNIGPSLSSFVGRSGTVMFKLTTDKTVQAKMALSTGTPTVNGYLQIVKLSN